MKDKLDAAQVSTRARKKAARELLVGVAVDEDANNLAPANLANDLPIDPTDRIDFVRPVHGIVRPDQPRGLVSLPLARHRETERGGRGGCLDLAANSHGIAILSYSDSLSLPRTRGVCKGILALRAP